MIVFPRGRRLSLGLTSLTCLTDVPVSSITKEAVTFTDDLDAETSALVLAWLDATDDADQAARAVLRADRDALEPDADLRRLYNYMLGDVS